MQQRFFASMFFRDNLMDFLCWIFNFRLGVCVCFCVYCANILHFFVARKVDVSFYQQIDCSIFLTSLFCIYTSSCSLIYFPSRATMIALRFYFLMVRWNWISIYYIRHVFNFFVNTTIHVSYSSVIVHFCSWKCLSSCGWFFLGFNKGFIGGLWVFAAFLAKAFNLMNIWVIWCFIGFLKFEFWNLTNIFV